MSATSVGLTPKSFASAAQNCCGVVAWLSTCSTEAFEARAGAAAAPPFSEFDLLCISPWTNDASPSASSVTMVTYCSGSIKLRKYFQPGEMFPDAALNAWSEQNLFHASPECLRPSTAPGYSPSFAGCRRRGQSESLRHNKAPWGCLDRAQEPRHRAR